MTTKPTALDAYMENQAAALALVERIQAAIANHGTAPAPEEIHWGHVGDMVETRSSFRPSATASSPRASTPPKPSRENR
jgi:hypothetical protein